MTPQLQQAIRLLQLSSLEIQAEIQQALESNPLLEVKEDFDYDIAPTSDKVDDSQRELAQLDAQDIPDDLPVDSQWDDIYDVQTSHISHQRSDNEFERENRDSSTDSLQQYLLWQMQLTPFTPTEQAIAATLIDSINDDGYLNATLEEIQHSLLSEYDSLELDEIEAVLHRIQQFDPIGVAARDLRECLLIQLNAYDANQLPHHDLLRQLIDQHLPSLAKHDYAQIKRALKIKEDELTSLVRSIQLLQPRPGSQIQCDKTEYIVPDVYLRKRHGQWHLSLNPDNAPQLQIADHYAQLINRADDSADNTYLKNHLQEARWFLKSLQSRNDTLLKVTEAIIAHQKDFLEQGDEAMKPLVLADIADIVDMHESTISRITTRKYIHTPRGIFELKYFFSSHVATDTGGECSATAIRAIIKKLVMEEDPRKPLSDNKIATLLGEKGINVARRTIAKYRESLAIPPSNERKRLV